MSLVATSHMRVSDFRWWRRDEIIRARYRIVSRRISTAAEFSAGTSITGREPKISTSLVAIARLANIDVSRRSPVFTPRSNITWSEA
jgi:hypothetical protein